ncbi:hypothetical protein AXK11_05835 [Cephaloticoccus primus]|uniref:PEP-CTERM protein-sorting domain-containing protein n=1 Tax=Cephaloticoccus primus TaxID=1548207 RepID=A0A139SM39_9BACT|nr:PEP-CTERM sorting domain-containing protein [Cephaloticoccus primus]KXU35638.1 hypothetical protein AXK11_05835 [Cephaloticoccus primus]
MNVEIVGTERLTWDREVGGIWMDQENDSVLGLQGKTLTVGAGGINVSYSDKRLYLGNGQITSNESAIVIHAGTYGTGNFTEEGQPVNLSFSLSAVIKDHKDHKVGLILTGKHPAGERGQERGIVALEGDRSNTYTGDTVVDGVYNALYLSKKSEATAIAGNLYVKNGAAVNLLRSNQIADSSSVFLTSGAGLMFSSIQGERIEKIRALIVEKGVSKFDFGHLEESINDKRTLILDDLSINNGALLRIMRWQEGRDHLLVRKDSKHLADALKKITIDGWAKNQIYLKDYDKDYWSIEAAPEPTTYGALLGAMGLGVFVLRRRLASRGKR